MQLQEDAQKSNKSGEHGRKSLRSLDDKGVSGSGAWLGAHYDPVASLYTFSSCMALEDLTRDGDHKLLVGDLGTGHCDMKLKVYRGTELMFETPLLDLPTGVCTFFMDATDPCTPAVAVSAGPFVYVYKNLRPYFKFTLPSLELNAKEAELWAQVKEDRIDATMLRDLLERLNEESPETPLTVCSQRFIQLEPEDFQPFVSVFKHIPLKRQSVITAITTLKKAHAEDNAVSCLLVSSENCDVYVLDPEAFTVLLKMAVPAVPVFLSAVGLFDVEYQLHVACRDACVYTLRTGDVTPHQRISLSSQPVGLVCIDHSIYVGCMDNSLSCYSSKSGKRHWVSPLPAPISAMEIMDYRPKGFKGVVVATKNCELRVYRDKNRVNCLQLDDVVVGIRFGRFGREDGALLLVTQGGALIVKMLKRTVSFEAKELWPGPPQAQNSKLSIPKKTKVFVEQTLRERKNATAIHTAFQKDLYRLRLETARAYVTALSSHLAPLSTTCHASLKVAAQVQGLGPLFHLTVTVQNTSPSSPLLGLYLSFKCDTLLYRMESKFIQLPLLVPTLCYSFEAVVECVDDTGRTEPIVVYVLKHESPAPLVSAAINMPPSENIIVV